MTKTFFRFVLAINEGRYDMLPDEYQGQQIMWHGYKGRMVKVPIEDSYPIWGNTFEESKIDAMVDAIKGAVEEYHFDAPLVSPTLLDLDDVVEYIQERDGDRMFDPCFGEYVNFTTGDPDLDKYVKDKELWLEKQGYRYTENEIRVYMESPERSPFGNDEDIQDAVALYIGMEDDLSNCHLLPKSDVGKVKFQVRDGNHRRCTAYRTGETFFYGLVTTAEMNSRGDWKTKVRLE